MEVRTIAARGAGARNHRFSSTDLASTDSGVVGLTEVGYPA
jgi:hypothetical protein